MHVAYWKYCAIRDQQADVSLIFLCTSKYEHSALILENMCCFYFLICKVQTKMK